MTNTATPIHFQARPGIALCGAEAGPFDFTIRSERVTCTGCCDKLKNPTASHK